MTTPGNFAKSYINGYDLTQDSTQLGFTSAFGDNRTMAQNTGIEQHAPGVYMPSLSYNGYKRYGQGAITAHNLLYPSGIGGSNDTEFIQTHLLGNNAAPAIGDGAVMMVSTLLDFKGPKNYTGQLEFSSQFRGRGVRMPLGVLIQDSAVANTVTSAVYDDGAESVDTVLGAAAILQIYTPTGIAATGTITFGGLPSDADTVEVNSVVYTFKNTLAAANQVKIGATAAATAQNLFSALTGGLGVGTAYYTGTTPVASTIIVSLPSASNVITLTAAATGTAANAYTLLETATNVTVSGAGTLAGGVAGDTAVIKIQHATASGGSYTDLITFTANGTSRTAEYGSVAIGTTIQRYLKVVATLSAGNHVLGFNVCFGRWFNL